MICHFPEFFKKLIVLSLLFFNYCFSHDTKSVAGMKRYFLEEECGKLNYQYEHSLSCIKTFSKEYRNGYLSSSAYVLKNDACFKTSNTVLGIF